MRTLSACRLPRAASGARARGQCPRALNQFDVIVEYRFDDKGDFSKVFEGYAWEALARGVPVAEVVEEAEESAWGNMASGTAAEAAKSPPSEPEPVTVDPAVAKAEAQVWIAAYRDRNASAAPVAEKEAAPAANGRSVNGSASNGNGAASVSGAEEARAWIAAWRSKNAKSGEIQDAGVWPNPVETEPSAV